MPSRPTAVGKGEGVVTMEVERGGQVVLDEEGWRARYQKLVGKGAMLWAIVLMVVLIVLDAIFFWAMSNAMDAGEFRDLVRSFFYILIIGDALVVAVVVVVYYMVRMRRPTPGIYEGGVQLPNGRFVPFDTIRGIAYEKRTWIVTRGTITLTCPTEEGSPEPFSQWVVPYDLFGQEGYDAISERYG
jgi:hypothetical protein